MAFIINQEMQIIPGEGVLFTLAWLCEIPKDEIEEIDRICDSKLDGLG